MKCQSKQLNIMNFYNLSFTKNNTLNINLKTLTVLSFAFELADVREIGKIVHYCSEKRVGDIHLYRERLTVARGRQIIFLFLLHRGSHCVPDLFEGEAFTRRTLFGSCFCRKLLAANTPQNLSFATVRF